MFRKLFGETEMEQLRFLHLRSIVTLVIIALMVMTIVFNAVGLSYFADAIWSVAELAFGFIMMLIWGWPVIKGMFGIATIGTILSGNVAVGVLLFLLYVFLAYILGILFSFVGILRYIYLRIKYREIE